MKIKRIILDNFRIFKHVDVELGEQMNVCFGINGAGKSTFLEAINILLSWFAARMQSRTGKGKPLQDSDISIGERECRLIIELDDGTSWKLYKQRSTMRIKAPEASDLSGMTTLINGIYNNKFDFLSEVPFIANYSVDRAVTNVPTYVGKKHLLNPIDIYKGFADNKTNFRSFFEWFREREDLENENYRYYKSDFFEDYQLKAVREALEKALPDYRNLRIQRSPRAILVDKLVDKKKEKFYFGQLSDGEKCYITLIGDIARKLAMSKGTPNKPNSGIVLIDEIDLHLHPSWQQGVVSSLKSAFPDVQFILTTHSPFVLSSIKVNEESKILRMENGNLENETDMFGASVNDVLLKLFRLQTLRNLEVQSYIDKAWNVLKEGNLDDEEYNRIMHWLEENLDSSDIEFAKFALERKLKERQLREYDKNK